jgi:DNA-binding transcriptional ArsR family regulator
MSMEFELYTNLETALPKVIDFNFEQLKTELASRLEHYNSLVVTEDSIKDAKADKALLNKLREAIEDKRKEIKKAVSAPYAAFEVKVKELVALIDQPISAIDKQLDVYEQRRKAEKRSQIEAFWTENMPEGFPVAMDKLFDERWLNASIPLKRATAELNEKILKVSADLNVISTVDLQYAEQVKGKYLDTLDLAAAIAEQTRLKEIAERIRLYDEARACAPAPIEAPKPQAPAAPLPAAPAVTAAPTMDVAPSADIEVFRVVFECFVTRDQALALKTFFDSRNISFRRIKG